MSTSYEIQLKRSAEKELDALPARTRSRITKYRLTEEEIKIVENSVS
jgi:mRNA-degrading endonuclease RelE of RelBE toxin-antitoxin system